MPGVASFSVNLYGGMAWGLVSLKQQRVASQVRFACGLLGNGLVVLLAPLAGALGDRLGVAATQLATATAVVLCGVPLVALLLEAQELSDWQLVAVYSCFGVFHAFGMGSALQAWSSKQSFEARKGPEITEHQRESMEI